MVSVNIRELTHHLSSYLKQVKDGERIVILERHSPVADLIPHNEHVEYPGWKRRVERIKIKGEPLSQTVIKNRGEEKL